MHLQAGRPAKLTSLVAVILVLAIVGVAAVAYVSSGSPSSQSTSASTTIPTSTAAIESSSASESSSSGGLTITNMFADVMAPGDQAPTSNSSSVADQTAFTGSPGETFLVAVQVVYTTCSMCPSEIASVSVSTPGFVILGTTPAMPQGLLGAGPDGTVASFTVQIRAPSAPYTGTLTIVAQAQ